MIVDLSMIKVLGRQTSGNVQKVLFVLAEAGLEFTREDYGRQFNNTQTPEYKALNPNGKVPTLIDGDVVIWESNTILRYLAATYAPGLTGATPAERSEVERWMDWLLASINPLYLTMFKDAKKPADERVSDFEAQAKELAALLGLAEAHLAGKSFFALGRLTLADIALAPIVKRCLAFPLDLPALANLKAWLAAIEARPAFSQPRPLHRRSRALPDADPPRPPSDPRIGSGPCRQRRQIHRPHAGARDPAADLIRAAGRRPDVSGGGRSARSVLAGHRPCGARGGLRLPHRPLGLRQEHLAQGSGRARPAELRRASRSRPRAGRGGAQAA